MDIFSYDIYSKIPSHCDYITFGMGCFWGAEKRFWTLKDVKTTIVGYAGGNKENPSYEEVCVGTTGHAEVVKVIFEKNKLPLHTLFKVFWESHDPTQLNRQGNDIGTQYRSAIYVKDKNELELAEKSKLSFQKKLNENGFSKIQTEIKIVKDFFYAEEYHQKYLYKNPNGYCGLKGLGVELK